MAGFKQKTSGSELSEMRALVDKITQSPDLSPEKDSQISGSEIIAESPITIKSASFGNIVVISVGEIKENPWNARREFPSSKLESIASSLKQDGQLVPCAGFIGKDNRVTLIDGHCRLRAAIAVGIETLRVELREVPTSDKDLYLLSREMNIERAEQTPVDDAIAWKLLIERKVFPNQSVLAKAVGVSEGAVSKTISIADLPRSVIAAISEHHELSSLRPLYEILLFWKARGEDETLELVAEAKKKGMSSRDITARRRTAEKGTRQKPRSLRTTIRYKGGIGELRRFDVDGRLELSIRSLTIETLDELETKINEILSTTPQLALS